MKYIEKTGSIRMLLSTVCKIPASEAILKLFVSFDNLCEQEVN
jgi:hypothetical protein